MLTDEELIAINVQVGQLMGEEIVYRSVAITIQEYYGLGLYCWTKFRVLSEAQDFVERLMQIPVVQLKSIHGRNWPNVVL